MRILIFAILNLALVATRVLAAETPPLKVLLVAGGCCHDYANQKDILKAGLEKRANVKVDIAYSADRNTKPALPILGNPDYAKGYDVVIHDECAADIDDVELIKGVLAPHRAGIPGVNLHCAMHSYRVGRNYGQAAELGAERGAWFEYLGVQSSSHGPQYPIAVSYAVAKSPITAGFSDWTTITEELYNNVQIYPTATVLARGVQTEAKKDCAVIWTNNYHGTRVFSTTLGHHNETVGSDRYLDLITRGLLWACKKLDDSGKPLPGYGPVASK